MFTQSLVAQNYDFGRNDSVWICLLSLSCYKVGLDSVIGTAVVKNQKLLQ